MRFTALLATISAVLSAITPASFGEDSGLACTLAGTSRDARSPDRHAGKPHIYAIHDAARRYSGSRNSRLNGSLIRPSALAHHHRRLQPGPPRQPPARRKINSSTTAPMKAFKISATMPVPR